MKSVRMYVDSARYQSVLLNSFTIVEDFIVAGEGYMHTPRGTHAPNYSDAKYCIRSVRGPGQWTSAEQTESGPIELWYRSYGCDDNVDDVIMVVVETAIDTMMYQTAEAEIREFRRRVQEVAWKVVVAPLIGGPGVAK